MLCATNERGDDDAHLWHFGEESKRKASESKVHINGHFRSALRDRGNHTQKGGKEYGKEGDIERMINRFRPIT